MTRLPDHSAPRALILVYHRVAVPRLDPQRLCVTPEHFAQQLDVLRATVDVVTLGVLVTSRPAVRTARPRVALTFDDGYLDNLTTAAPLLAARALPATIFVITQALQLPSLFWWDVLQRCVLEPRSLPPLLEIQDRAGAIAYKLDEVEVRDARMQGGSQSHSRETIPGSPRHQLYLELHRRLLGSTVAVQQRVVAELARWAGVSTDPAGDARPMRPHELQDLAVIPGMEIATHTRTHPRLALYPPGAQRREIEGSVEDLFRLLDRPVRFLSYPYGCPRDITRLSPWLARRAGLVGACLGIENTSTPRHSPYRLTRAQVPDLDGEAFARWLALRL